MPAITFNIAQARKDGHTDDEIKKYIEARRSQGVDINPSENIETPIAKEENNPFVDVLPLVGAIGGSFIPGLGTIAGGAVGAGAGALAKNLLDKKPGVDIGDVGREAALGAAGGVVGKGVGYLGGKVLSKVGSKGVAGAFDDAAKGLKQGTRQIKQQASVYGASKEKLIHETLNKYGFKGDAQKQYEMLQPTIEKIEGDINQFIKANPGLKVAKEDIKKSFLYNLRSNIRTKDLSMKQAQSEVDGYLMDLLKASGGTGKFKDISLERLRKLKKLVNADYGRVYKKMTKGDPLTPTEKVVNVAWGSLDDAVKGVSPEIKALLKDESNLYASAGNLSGARFNPPTLRIAGTSVPQPVTHGLRDVAAGAAGAAGKVLSKTPNNLPRIVSQGAGQSIIRLPGEAINQNENNGQDYPQDYNQQENGQYNAPGDSQHTQNIPQGLQVVNDGGNEYKVDSYGNAYSMDEQWIFDKSQNEWIPNNQTSMQNFGKQNILRLMQQDLETTGGKNIAKLKTIYDLASRGEGQNKPLPVTAQTQLNLAKSGSRGLEEAIKIYNEDPSILTKQLVPGQWVSRRFDSAMFKAVEALLRARSGAAVPEQEVRRYMTKYGAIFGDSPDTVKFKFDQLRQDFQDVFEGAYNTAGSTQLQFANGQPLF